MKMNKKKLAVVSLAVCVLAILSLGSLAWYTAEDSLTNNLNFVNDFAMDLIETDDQGHEVGTGSSTTGLTINNIVPNQKIHKDPTVINKSAVEPQWIKMTVKVSKGQQWINFLGVDASLEVLFLGYDDTMWEHPVDPALDGNGNLVATFYLKDKLVPGASVTLFNQIYIHPAMKVADAANLNGTTITIEAKAIQSSAVGVDTCQAAFAKIG